MYSRGHPIDQRGADRLPAWGCVERELGEDLSAVPGCLARWGLHPLAWLFALSGTLMIRESGQDSAVRRF